MHDAHTVYLQVSFLCTIHISNRLVGLTEMRCVFLEVGTAAFLNTV
jgi:hypothetical protein